MNSSDSPAGSSSPPSQPGSFSAPPSWQATASHAISGGIAGFTAYKLITWLPNCLDFLRLPTGGISHDPYCWAPLILALGGIVAVASPTSFANLVSLAKYVPFLRLGSEPVNPPRKDWP
jgi:hypothetical protein